MEVAAVLPVVVPPVMAVVVLPEVVALASDVELADVETFLALLEAIPVVEPDIGLKAEAS